MEPAGHPAPVAIVTGAGSGIGRAVARLLSQRDWRLALVGRRVEPLLETAGMLPVAVDVLVAPTDMADAARVRAAVAATVERFGRIDALINNAGTAPREPIDRHTQEVIEASFRTNALGPANGIAAAWPVFARQRSGHIVNVSSMAAVDPFPGFFAYAAAKAAVESMVRSCAKEGQPIGVKAFAVAPGAVETGMLRALFSETEIPRERCLSPEAVARVIVACACGERDGDNGTTIPLPGP